VDKDHVVGIDQETGEVVGGRNLITKEPIDIEEATARRDLPSVEGQIKTMEKEWLDQSFNPDVMEFPSQVLPGQISELKQMRSKLQGTIRQKVEGRRKPGLPPVSVPSSIPPQRPTPAASSAPRPAPKSAKEMLKKFRGGQ